MTLLKPLLAEWKGQSLYLSFSLLCTPDLQNLVKAVETDSSNQCVWFDKTIPEAKSIKQMQCSSSLMNQSKAARGMDSHTE